MFTHLLLISKTWNSAYRNLQVLKNTDFIAFAFSLPQMKKKKECFNIKAILYSKYLVFHHYMTGTHMSINPCI